jgi:hypothetical protein
MYLHRKQFLIGPQPYRLNETWNTHPLNNTLWLSCCAALRVIKIIDADGRNWYILGLAVETLPGKLSPQHEIVRAGSDRVPTLYASWAGRWILVGNDTLHLDASGLLGCFYGRGSHGDPWASSSAALLAQILGSDQVPEVDSRSLKYEVGISWYTPPRTRFSHIHRLLPSQVLQLSTGQIQPRSLMPAIQPDCDYSTTLEHIQTCLVTALKQLPAISDSIWLGLTAGYDSRLMLALSQVANVTVKPYTRIAARMSVADRLLPPQLAQTSGYPHILLHRDRRFPERQALADAHSGGQISSGDAEPFVRGDRDGLQGISFGGHGFAIASGFGNLRTLPLKLNSAAEGAQQIAMLLQEPLDSTATAGLQDWLEWVLAHPEPHLDWRDRFFLEQRQAGWLSTKEQVYDLTDVERFPILNCARLYSLLLSIPAEQRLGSQIQTALLQRLSPPLMAYPFNPTDAYFGLKCVIVAKAKNLPEYIIGKMLSKLRWFLKTGVLRRQSRQ